MNMRADRLLSLMLLLEARGKMTAQDLAEELEVSRRTILRDIDALSFAGIPIYAEGGHGGGISLDENYRVKLNGLKEAEVQALILSNNAALLADIGLEQAAERSLLKLLSALPSLHEQTARHIQNRIYIDPIWWWRGDYRPTSLKELQQAVYEDRLIEIIYQKHNGDVIQRVVEPYGMIAKAGVWYLVAAHGDGYRSYRVSRIKHVSILEDYFSRDPTFDLATYWQTSVAEFITHRSVYKFTLKIANDRLNFVKWYAPGSYELIETASEDWFTARFEVESLEVAVMFVFGLGVNARILEPRELQETILQRSRLISQSATANQDVNHPG